MHTVVDVQKLLDDKIINQGQAEIISERARAAMINLGINTILCFGILAATGGFIFWLADTLSVAVTGIGMAGLGLLVLKRARKTLSIFGNAAVIIGVGMLVGGGAAELFKLYNNAAGPILAVAGAALLIPLAWWRAKNDGESLFLIGSLLLMGAALHLGGIGLTLEQFSTTGILKALAYLYTAIVIALMGWLINLRFVTALAIVPFAQMLETGTAYWHAAYVFYSPEPTLTILQMAALVGACVYAGKKLIERHARHTRILATMGFIVANLSGLVGSLFGDKIGQTLWGPGSRFWRSGQNQEDWNAANEAYLQSAIIISDHAYSIAWALALIAMIVWAAFKHQRALFNTALTFAGIHAYTQLFETFADEPLAYVVGGLAAIPLAWGLMRANSWLAARQKDGQNTP